METNIKVSMSEKIIEPVKWAVMITTAPRMDCTLQKCIDSIKDAGWDYPIVVAEPGSTVTSEITYWNHSKLGVWHNWVNAMKLALKTDADAILSVQDDSYFHPDSKIFSEYIMWPDNCGFISLYTPKHYSFYNSNKRSPGPPVLKDPGVNRIYTRSLWGACALVFPRNILEQFMASKLVESWLGAPPRSRDPGVLKKRREDPSIIANSDTAIGKFMNWNKLYMYTVDPSPVQHIAIHSTIKHGDNKGRRNAHRIADLAIPLIEQVPVCSTQ